MSDEDEAARYLLPEAANRRIFWNAIVPEQFAGRVPQQTPSAVFLLGQPGAGKTRVAQMIGEVLNQRGGFIDVDSDLYKPYHPDYDTLMRHNDRLMATYIGADGRRWTAQTHQYARDRRLNVLVQEIGSNSEWVAVTMRAYRSAGFRVEVMAMGVGEAMSGQGILNRYHEQVKERGAGRLTVQQKADASYLGILDLAQRVDDEYLADRVGVFRRGEAEPRYRNELNERGRWREDPGLRAAIIAERNRPWTLSESADFLQVQGKLHIEMGPEWAERLRQIDRLAAPFLAPATVLDSQDLERVASHPGPQQTDAEQEKRRREHLQRELRHMEQAGREHIAVLKTQGGEEPGRVGEVVARGFPTSTREATAGAGGPAPADPRVPLPRREHQRQEPDLDR